MARVMHITTPLDEDVLLFHSIAARDELGRLFEYTISVLSERNDIDPNKLLGKNVTVGIELPDGGTRHFDACVTRFAFVGVHGRYLRYEITGRPWLWFLTRAADCRIFQNKNVPDIIEEIFGKYGNAAFELDKLTGTYEPWEYCVQYCETDFNFVSRLMEQEGIYYYFTHSDGKHLMVFADSPSAPEPFPGYEEIPFVAGEQALRIEQERVSAWGFSWEVQPGAYAIDDFDFKKPSVELLQQTTQQRDYAEAKHEIYDYPGEYLSAGKGETYVRLRLEELQAQVQLMQAEGNARGVAVGRVFKLTGQPREDQNRKYLITAATLTFASNEYESSQAEGASYRCSFSCVNADDPFRTPRTTRRPIVQGLQTAIVVGPAGDEIYTDEYGRVKVHFHWDRHGKDDENASCWMRVSHPWAGKNFGMIATPRIGQEVIVEFLEGDPDRPLITGRVYNAEQMPPWALPGNKTQTGVLTRSSLGGSSANANAIRFEDKKGSEQLWIHAEKNQDIEVENDETHWVGHDRTKTIDHDETTHVKHDRTETVDNNETITIHANRTETVDKEEKITIHGGRTEEVDKNESIKIHGARTEIVDKDESITIHGARTEKVDKNETITIDGARTETVAKDETITINGGRTETVAKNETITINGGRTETVAKNETITINGGRTETVAKEESITINGGRTESVAKDESVSVTGGRTHSVGKDDTLKVTKNLSIDAGDSVTITTGSASISMKKDGTIVIKGKDITIDGSGKINIKAGGDIVMKGSKILQN